MQNLLSFLLFQIFGLGISSLFFPLIGTDVNRDDIGTSVFWGSWLGMLLAYVFALILPSHLNIACYGVALISLSGVIRLVFRNEFFPLIRTPYFLVILALLPFVAFLVHMPASCDEYGHWVFLPKIYVITQEFVTAPVTSGKGYTPLWPLEGAFFQFFVPGNFSESILATLKVAVFVSFLFFVKEALKIGKICFFIFSLVILFLTNKFNTQLGVEFPLYILITAVMCSMCALERSGEKGFVFLILLGTLALYMVKKSMILILPFISLYLWNKNYRKEVFWFLLIFFSFVGSWKLKTLGQSEFLCLGCKINSLVNCCALLFYKNLFVKLKNYVFYFFCFGISLYVIYKESKNLFLIYFLFSLLFLISLVLSYLFSFSIQEALSLASFLRYLTSIFYPAYTLAFCFLMMKIFPQTGKIEERTSPWVVGLGFVFLASIIGFSYVHKGNIRSKKDQVGSLVSKIPRSRIPSDRGNLLIGPQSLLYEIVRFKYHLYPPGPSLVFCPFETLSVAFMEDALKRYRLIIVRQPNQFLDKFFMEKYGIQLPKTGTFYLYKDKNKMKVYPL